MRKRLLLHLSATLIVAAGLANACGSSSDDDAPAAALDSGIMDASGDVLMADGPVEGGGDGGADDGGSGTQATVQVLTQRYDMQRSGLNLRETVLDTGNVQHDSFGKLYARSVDDELYAQLLVATDVAIAGKGERSVVFAATVNNSIYAFDAEDAAETEPLWHVNYTPPGARPTRASDMTGACGGDYRDFSNNMGIVSTPVIDRDTDTMYFVSRTFENDQHVQRFHAVDISDGGERPNSPVVINAQIQAEGDGSDFGTLTFDPLKHNQRTSLLLLDGVVYMSWAGHCDWPPYHGWLMGYDAATLEQEVVWNVTPDGAAGGIWQSGQGLTSDGTYIYAVSGNGTVGEDGDLSSTRNRGQSFLKLQRAGSTLEVVSWFTPYDWQYLEQYDLDLGSAGLLLIPGTHLGVSGGKGGRLYVVDTDAMGGLSSSGFTDDNVIQSFDLNEPNHLHSTPLFWQGPNGGRVYTWAEEDYLKAFPVLAENYSPGSTVLDVDHVELSTVRAPTGEGEILMPGGFLALSADGEALDTAILWASLPYTGNANQDVRPGILRALNAADVSQELWNNRDDEERDNCGNFPKFAVPTVANGKVYLGSFSNQFCVYGLLD
jgi:hypothetical protein